MRYSIDISVPAKTKGPEARPDLLARDGYVVLVPRDLGCPAPRFKSPRPRTHEVDPLQLWQPEREH